MRRQTLLLQLVIAAHGLVYVELSTTEGIRKNGTLFQDQASFERKWLAQIFMEAKERFDMDSTVNAECAGDYQRYKLNLLNQTLWAIRMAESTEWPLGAIMAGVHEHMGNWEECLMVSSMQVKGQYCVVRGVYHFAPNPASPYGTSVQYHSNEEASAWDTLQMYGKSAIRINRQKLSWAMCIPSSCTHAELKRSVDKILQPLFEENKLNITVEVDPLTCTVKKSPKYTTGFYLVSAFIAVCMAIVLTTGLYEFIIGEEYTSKDTRGSYLEILFEDFSWVRSFKKLTSVSHSAELSILNMLKIVYMVIIILGHRMLYFFLMPSFNAEHSEIGYWNSIRLSNLNVVDAFFFVSGVLTFYHGFEPVKESGGIIVLIGIVARWMRMVPVLSTLQLFVIYVLPYLNDGPNWNRLTVLESENCKASFWANFFSVSNIFSADNQCLMISWYVSVDMQLTIIGCTLLLGMAKSKKIGFFLTVITFIGASAITFAVVNIKRYNGLLLLTFEFLYEPRSHDEFNYFYTAFYPRIPPYIVGFLTAYISKSLMARGYKFSSIQNSVLLLIGSCIKIAVMLYGLQFYQIERPYNPTENGIFAATSRWMYVIFDATAVVIMITTSIASLGRIFRSVLCVSLSRLTYSAFLMNTVVQFYHAASQRTRIDSSMTINQCWWVMGDIAYTYILGFFLYLFLENPFSNISKRVIKKMFSSGVKPKTDSSTAQTATDKIAESSTTLSEKPDASETN